MATIPDRNSRSAVTAQDVIEILGPLAAARVTAIVATGATVGQLEQAAAWAAGESDAMGELERPVSGPVAAVYDILTAEEEFAEDRG